MTERRNEARGANEWQEIYGNVGLSAPTQLLNLPLDLLDPWEDENGDPQPFDPYSPEELAVLADHILTHGIIEPIHARPKSNGRFQILAGHNRCAASKLAGLTVIPSLVRQMDDNQAGIIMVDSNLKHRPYLLPSNKAKAYKIKMDRLLRSAGRKNNGAPLGPHFESSDIKGRSRDILASDSGDSREQIRRYLRLNDLHPALLTLVDNSVRKVPEGQKKLPQISLHAGVDLSYLKAEEQSILVDVMEREKLKPPSMAQAKALRHESEDCGLTEERIMTILRPPRAVKAITNIKLPGERITSFFPQNTSPELMEAEIYKALLAYRKAKQSSASA